MKITPGWWLVYVNIVYWIVGLTNIFVYTFVPFEYVSFAYCVILSLPLWIPPVARFCNMKVIWRK